MSIPSRYIKDFKPDAHRILEAVLYLISRRRDLSQYDIVKSLFLADRRQMNASGRPITFDNYTAMVNGPVPSLAYDAVKPGFADFERIFGEQKPWITVRDGNKNIFSTALRPPNLSVLSATDLEALDDALQTVKSLTFTQLKMLTHEDAAYKEAWARRGDAASSDMKMSLLFEEDGEDAAEDIAYVSRYAV